MIVRYRCDVPMADKKGMRQVCDRKCRNCLCAIAMTGSGEEHHVGMVDEGSCGNVTRRNSAKISHALIQEANRLERIRNNRSRVDWRFDGRRANDR